VLPILLKYAAGAEIDLPENGTIDPSDAKQVTDLVKAIESSPAIPFVHIDHLIRGNKEKVYEQSDR
jgi:hypothetical protein